MNHCSYSKLLADFLNDDLSPAWKSRVKAHLGSCESCSAVLRELQIVHDSLRTYRRPQPSATLLRRYKRALHRQFATRHRRSLARIGDKLRKFGQTRRAFAVRLLPLAAVLLFGIFIGKLIFERPTGESISHSVSQGNQFGLPEPNLRHVQDFLLTSEMLLLEIMNHDSAASDDDTDLVFNRKIAQKLLMKTFLVHEQVLRLGDRQALAFLTQLELLLYELANSADAEAGLAEELRMLIRKNNLLNKNRHLRDLYSAFARKQRV